VPCPLSFWAFDLLWLDGNLLLAACMDNDVEGLVLKRLASRDRPREIRPMEDLAPGVRGLPPPAFRRYNWANGAGP
jgi:hypothetical protein